MGKVSVNLSQPGKVIAMTGPGRGPRAGHACARWLGTMPARLRDPAVLIIIAVVFFVSALGQTVVQAYVHDGSVVTTAVLSVLGSMFVAAAILVAARRHDRTSRNQPPPNRDPR